MNEEGYPSVDPCPLCESTVATKMGCVPYSRIWEALREEWSATFPESLMSRLTPATDACLYSCTHCCLQYFSPICPADSEFSRQLSHSAARYEQERFEFGLVASLLGPDDDILDLGCGAGAFLSKVVSPSRRVVGIDHNQDAVDALRARGIESYAMGIQDFAHRSQRAFDVVCCFQTVEHLTTVEEVISPALLCLRPGGRLFLSMPNRNRHAPARLEPLDCPPHHASRWQLRQVEMLANRYRLTLVRTWYERLSYKTTGHLLAQRLADTLIPARRKLHATGQAVAACASLRSLLANPSRLRLGHTLLAELRPDRRWASETAGAHP